MEGKQTKGKQKIEMKKIEDANARSVSFSKRKSVIYKQASELVTMCNAEIGIVISSPSDPGIYFSFAHPSLKKVTNRFMNETSTISNNLTIDHIERAKERAKIDALNQEYNELMARFEIAKEKEKILKKLNKERKHKGWWEIPKEELGEQELKQVNKLLDDLGENLKKTIAEKTSKSQS